MTHRERANNIVKLIPGIHRPNPEYFEEYLNSGQGKPFKEIRDLIEKELDNAGREYMLAGVELQKIASLPY